MWTVKEIYKGVPIYQNGRDSYALRVPPGSSYMTVPAGSDFAPFFLSVARGEIDTDDRNGMALYTYNEEIAHAQRAAAAREQAEADALPAVYAALQEELA